MVAELLVVALALGFSASIGAHYTGACMGMPHALGLVSARKALLLMAPLAFLGAALASHAVEARVGTGLVQHRLTLADEVVVLALAFSLTTAFNRFRVPTSTIQLLVFSLVGVALGSGAGVRWSAIASLVVLWILAPLVALGLGFTLTLSLDRLRAGLKDHAPGRAASVWRFGGSALILVGLAASFAMGANDVSNATGALVGARVLAAGPAGVLGGLGLAAGVLIWGRPLLARVAFDIVRVDRVMAVAAQLGQAAVVLVAVSLGYFTSLNQALVGAMAGAGLARGRETVQMNVLLGILRGWVLGPGSGLALGYGLSALLVVAFGTRLLGP
ncbi:MAG TPA: inorganic phosphate transporter [Candidatus Dormibacteraeota bacterium]|nr:inorganic phosphate transporter [Candidatus Dormibacteraeota bacterium]